MQDEVKDCVIVIALLSILVEKSYHGIVDRPFAVARLFYNKKIFGHT